MSEPSENQDNLPALDPPEALAQGVERITLAASSRVELDRDSQQQRDRDTAEEADRHLKNTTRINRESEELIAQLEETYREDLARIEESALREVREFEDSLLTNQKEIRDHAKKTTQTLQSRMEEASWLAEAVYEANENKPRIDFEKFRESVETRKIELEELIGLSRTEVLRYRQRPGATRELTQSELEEISERPSEALGGAATTTVNALAQLKALKFARIYRGALPLLIICAFIGVGVGIAYLKSAGATPESGTTTTWVGIGFGAGLIVLALGWLLARRHVKSCWKPIRTMQARLDRISELLIEKARETRAQQEKANLVTRDHEIKRANTKYPPLIEAARADSIKQIEELERDVPRNREQMADRNTSRTSERESTWTLNRDDARNTLEEEVASELARHEQRTQEINRDYQAQQEELVRSWKQQMGRSERAFTEITEESARLHLPFDSEAWSKWSAPTTLPHLFRFGQLHLDRTRIEGAVTEEDRFAVSMPETLPIPAVIGYPKNASLFIECDPESRAAGMQMIRSLMTRLIASMPPGKMRLTIIDPIGLGESFAGFMHLADHDEKLISDRIWTETRHIEQRLLDITEHMETVIQKYLRNEFESIIDYNQAAGEIAEPLRYLIISDFPSNFTDAATKRLASIATSGPRCGVHTIILHDTRRELPESIDRDTLTENSVKVLGERNQWRLADPRIEHIPLKPDDAPGEELITQLANAVGSAAVKADRVEVPFQMIAPKPDQYWTASSTRELEISLGRTGATKLQQLCLGVGTAQHALIAGKTGSGKSTLLHALVTNLACWYSPDEVEFWLVDFKKGVEFKVYANHDLPHARAVAVESDREFGVSVLKGLDEELKRRGDLYRQEGVQDLAGFRAARPDTPMPRVLLIIDEFQELFVEDDKLSQDASMLLDRLVRQGRAFGMHVVLGSQTLAGAYSLARSTMGQMGVRIALQCSESDSQVILSDDNSAARLLARPGEAIYNDQSGLIEGNSPFQVCWLDDQTREACLERVTQLARDQDRHARTIVFEGSKPANLDENRLLQAAIESDPAPGVIAPHAWLGEAVAIKDPTSGRFRRQTAANLLVIGQRDDASIALSAASLLSLAAHYSTDGVAFTILDGTPADDVNHGLLEALAQALPHRTNVPSFHDTDEAIIQLGRELAERTESGTTDAPAHFLLIHGLQRYRTLRRNENDFGFGMDEDTPPTPDKILASIIREGPMHGIHVLTWCDTISSLQRVFDRQGIGEFDQRVLFQVSATDSSTLIDSPAGSRLGFNRALLYSEEHGTIEKFRPWEVPSRDWMVRNAQRLADRQRTS